MYPFKHMLVGLKLNAQDEKTVRYASAIGGLLKSERITFLTVSGKPELPEGLRAKFPELFDSGHDRAKKLAQEAIDKHFQIVSGTSVECRAVEGDRLEEILRFIKENDVDLMLLSKKLDRGDGGILAEKLARKAPCSVLIIPRDQEPRITRILVALDFSEYSSDALEKAVKIASACGINELDCLHVYGVPTGYSRTGKSYEEFADIVLENSRKDFEKYIDRQELHGIAVKPLFELNERPSKAIAEVAERNGCDLVVVGARGRSAGAAVILGSVTERLLRLCKQPVLAVKRKDHCMGLLDAIFSC
jgi:nucleotide-binding universal stress UspA family protein